MGVDDAVWASIRRAHSETDEQITAFCERYGVSRSAYYARRRREGWPPRPKDRASLQAEPVQTPVTAARAAVAAAKAASKQAPESRQALAKRLHAAIDHELRQLEIGADARGGVSVQDIERRTRTLMNMIRGFEKVLELGSDKQKPKRKKPSRGNAGDGRSAADEAARMRHEIAERLERLHAQWSDGAKPCSTDGGKS